MEILYPTVDPAGTLEPSYRSGPTIVRSHQCQLNDELPHVARRIARPICHLNSKCLNRTLSDNSSCASLQSFFSSFQGRISFTIFSPHSLSNIHVVGDLYCTCASQHRCTRTTSPARDRNDFQLCPIRQRLALPHPPRAVRTLYHRHTPGSPPLVTSRHTYSRRPTFGLKSEAQQWNLNI
jgi:hypothetical protein